MSGHLGTKLAAGVAAAAGALFGSIAVAEWLATGSGSGTARAGHADELVASAGTPVVLLYPGGTGDVAVTISNPNPFPMVVNAVTLAGTITSDTAGCTAGNHGVTFVSQVGSWAVPADDDVEVVLPDAASMAESSADACQDATFTIPLRLQAGAGAGSDAAHYPYYTGPAGTANVGNCRPGVVDGEGTVVSPEVTPEPEVASDGIDNDCDGVTDEAS